MLKKSSVILVIVILCVELKILKCEPDPDAITSIALDFQNDCSYANVEENPWTATLVVRKVNNGNGNSTGEDYQACAILDEYTLLTYGLAFLLQTNKLAFYQTDQYSVLIGASRSKVNGLKFEQLIKVKFFQPHPYFARQVNYQRWMYSQNDYVIIKLKEKIKFGPNSRPVCLPKIGNNNSELNALYSENQTVVIGGWKKYKDLEKTSLTLTLASFEKCVEEWYLETGTHTDIYTNRVCGFTLRSNSNNPDAACIARDSGAVVQHQDQYIFMGFVNNYNSVGGICTQGSLYFIYKLNPWTLNWLNASLTCGPNQYTCHNGECAPLTSICNQRNDSCADGSDEDAKYCRALRPCQVGQFECGIYGACISQWVNGKEAQNCDGVTDCPDDGDDEVNCSNLGANGIPKEKVITGIGISVSILVLLFLPGGILIWRKLKMAKKGWRIPDEIITEFLDGSLESSPDPEANHENVIEQIERVTKKPYDSSAYEIPIECIEKGKFINGGTFGDVYQGAIKNFSRIKDCVCAIKIPKSNADDDQIKSFLKELKIMAYVGVHDHIVNFYGAYTDKLKEGILYMIVEYCQLGSMENFLQNYKECFKNQLKIQNQNPMSVPAYLYVDMYAFNTTDLINWSSQVTSGMAYLSSKGVIHGDLACRNILLDGDRVAKICDFGHSHHLYTNTTYLASPGARVPWKWMAVEALLDRKLSTKSDIWSFGVTMWEMFTLGQVPYGEMEWDPTFPYSLSSQGKCPLEQPEYANSEIFELMQKCWTIDPEQRPNFENLTVELTNEKLLKNLPK